MDWIIARLKERSTWLGIVGILTSAFALTLSDVQREAVIQTGLAIVSLIAVFMPEKAQPFPKPEVKRPKP